MAGVRRNDDPQPQMGSAPAASAGARKSAAPEQSRRPRRILLVEDSWVIGLQLQTMIELMGHEVIGPALTLAEALTLADTEPLDGAILDIRLNDVDVFPVAEALAARGVPFGFATGYTDEHAVPPAYRDAPRIAKPYAPEGVDHIIGCLLAGA